MRTDRTNFLNDIKQESLGIVNEFTSIEEQFQNKTLRPILKFQNELLLQFFISYATKNKDVFFNLSTSNKEKYIENSLQSDTVFRNQSIGMIVGLFSIEEYYEYKKNTSNLNKRILNMLIERWKSQLQLLDNK